MSDKTGGPAFPVVAENGLGHVADGMTLRDYAAIKAMQGILAHPKMGLGSRADIAKEAFLQADAMLVERDK